MNKESGPRLLLANLIAVVADGLAVLFIARALVSDYVDLVPFVVLIAACLVAILNIALISVGSSLPRQVFLALCAIALTGNTALLFVLGVVGMLGLALIGGGGNALMEQIKLVVYLATIAAIVVLNINLIANSRARARV